jgi:voltage-gated potassium channel
MTASDPANTQGGISNAGQPKAFGQSPPAPAATLRRRIYDVIEGGRGESPASRTFDGVIVTLIVLNVAAVVAETVPGIHAQYGPLLSAFEILVVSIFTIEYGLRLWTAVENPFLARLAPWNARTTIARSPALVIDLLAILPVYLHQLFPFDLGILRMLRLLRFLKLSRYSPAMSTLIRVLENERKALLGAALLLLTAILFSSTIMYHVEGTAQPDKFGSIPDAAWWAITTLSTVGYGDVTPVTPLGRFFAGLTMVMGLCILALPVAIISTGFAQEVHRRDFVVNWSLMSRVPLFAGLDATEAAELMPMLQAHNLPANVEIARKGAPADALFFVASGGIDQHGDSEKSTYRAGDVFGAAAMLNNDVHTGHVYTSSRSRLLKLHKDDFERIAARHPNVAEQIRQLASYQTEAEELSRLQQP